MKNLAFAADYDGTLAINGRISRDLIDALIQLRDSGRKLILVTGRQKDDLGLNFPQYSIFDRVVFENGALLYRPESSDLGELLLLTEKAPEPLIQLLKQRHVEPLSIGYCILATTTHHESTVVQCIKELGFNYSIILNKGSVMILPQGVNKGSGLLTALKELGISPSQTVGIGDGENDTDLLRVCGRSYAVVDATPGLKSIAQHVTRGGAHEGPLEVIHYLLEEDTN